MVNFSFALTTEVSFKEFLWRRFVERDRGMNKSSHTQHLESGREGGREREREREREE